MPSGTIDWDKHREDFERDGFTIIPGLISAGDLPRLEEACADIVAQTRAGSWPYRRVVGKQFPPYGDDDPDSWGVQHVMNPRLGPAAGVLARWYTSQRLIDAVTELLGCPEESLQMELFNLLINPTAHDFALSWHRDDVKSEASEADEQVALDAWKPHGIQWNTALYEDSCLFVVPGSHKIPRTPEQRLQSLGHDAPLDPLGMPNSIRVTLKPGETVFYNQNILHCASYSSKAPRVTLHACMGNIAGGFVRARNILQHGLAWMKEPAFMDGLDDRGKVMLRRLLALYDAVGAKPVEYSLNG